MGMMRVPFRQGSICRPRIDPFSNWMKKGIVASSNHCVGDGMEIAERSAMLTPLVMVP
jgi:hypothetical protein